MNEPQQVPWGAQPPGGFPQQAAMPPNPFPSAATPQASQPAPPPQQPAPPVQVPPPQQSAPPVQAPPVQAPPVQAPPVQSVPSQQERADGLRQPELFDQDSSQQESVDAQPSIQQLLRDFAKQPSCERYTSDAEKVKLIAEYLWLRQLTPDLRFETFLELYASVADFDKENLKHPSDAINELLPRSRKKAEEKQCQQWAAKDVVDYAALYVDMIRHAEATGTPIPMPLTTFLTSEPLIEQFRNGDFKEEKPKTKSKGKGKKKDKAPTTPPTGTQQRCIYTTAGNRQHRGYTTEYWHDAGSNQYYANFKADSGEEFQGLNVATLSLCDDPAPNPPQDVDENQLPTAAVETLRISPAEAHRAAQMLALPVPAGTVRLGDPIYTYSHTFPNGAVGLLRIMNGETGPYVDAQLVSPATPTAAEQVMDSLQPRKNLAGTYMFEYSDEVYQLEVVCNA